MRQVQLDVYGPPGVLHLVEVPDPTPGPGQVLIATDAAGITFVETQVRAGRSPRPGPPAEPPVVLGNGVEGRVATVGQGTDPTLVGRRVVTTTGGLGGYADRVVVDSADPFPVPESLAPGEAVALLADGRTALALLRAAAIRSGDRVLVGAAAGGVGSLLVQLVRRAGARTVAAAGGRRKLDQARTLGADVAVDYSEGGWTAAARAVAGGFDVVFDGIGGQLGRQLWELVEPGGRFLTFGMASGTPTDVGDATERGVTVVPGHTLVASPADNRALVAQALAEAEAGRLRPLIGQTYPLSRAADAHAAIEARTTIGKTLLLPDP